MESVDEFRARVRQWLSEHADEAPPNYGAILPPELLDAGVRWQRLLFKHGLAALHWPVEYGGQALAPVHTSVWLDECARSDVPPMLNMVGLVLAGGALLREGTDEQRARFLRSTASGEVVWCQLFSEPDAGSDLAGLSTRAVRVDGGYVIDGQKTWCSGGRCADWGILLARTGSADSRHRGISFFAVPMDAAGIEVRPLRQMTGDSHFDEVFFRGVALPSDLLIGAEGDGWSIAMSVLTNERGHVGASATAIERRLREVVDDAGRSRLSPPVRARVVELLARGRSYVWLASRAEREPMLGPVLKLAVTDLMFELAMLRGAVEGVSGLLDGDTARSMVGAPGGRIAGGSNEIQRNLIGERILGLPR
jgi:alkylation response protein AidB-like acyl-CoA dehydrogenase